MPLPLIPAAVPLIGGMKAGAAIWGLVKWAAFGALAYTEGKQALAAWRGEGGAEQVDALERELGMLQTGKKTQAAASKEMLDWLLDYMGEGREQVLEDQKFKANQLRIQRQHETEMLNRQIAGQAAMTQAEPYELAAQEAQMLRAPVQFDPNIPITALL